MPLLEATIPARYALILLDVVQAFAPAQRPMVLRAAGFGVEQLEQPDTPLTIAQFGALMCAANVCLGRSDVGFELGRRISFTSHAALGQLLAGCLSLENLLTLVARYYRLITPAFVARYQRGPSHGDFRIQIAAPMSATTLHQLLETHAVSIATDLKHLFGSEFAAEIKLNLAPPAHLQRYAALAPARFHFLAHALPELSCRFPTALLHRPLRSTTGGQLPAALAELDAARAAVAPARHYGDWVATMLREAQAIQPTLDDLAALLNLSPRTLSRRLAEEGINLRALGIRIRFQRARQLLGQTSTGLGQIAYQLGYADLPGFIRAFRTCAGITPAQYRQRRLG